MAKNKLKKSKRFNPAKHASSEKYSFLPDEVLDSLGKDKDTNVARRFRVSIHTVKKARRSRGIPRFTRVVPPEMERLFGKVSDEALAEQFNEPLHFVRKERIERGIPTHNPFKSLVNSSSFIADLGTMSDRHFGCKYGITTRSATYHRIKHGIESHQTKEWEARGG